MKVMTMVRSSEEREGKLGPPPQAMIDAVEKLSEDAAKAGIAVMRGGLREAAAGVIVSSAGGKVTVTDGPFAEAKEVVGGFAIFNVASKQEAVDWAVRLMELHREHWPEWEGSCEIREIWGDPSD